MSQSRASASKGRAPSPCLRRSFGTMPLACLLLAAPLLLAACATPVGVASLDLQASNRKLAENVLANQSLSAPTQQLLNRAALSERFAEDPAAAITALRTALPTASLADRCFALAELSFLHASLGGERSHYLAAAVYAYAYLFPTEGTTAPSPFDPRLITAVNLYNQGLTLGLATPEPGQVDLQAGETVHSLPSGEIAIRLDPAELRWGPFTMADFVAATRLDVRGLRNDYRWPGIGSALVASLTHVKGEEDWTFALVPAVLKVSATALLRIDNIDAVLAGGKLRGEMTLYTTQEGTEVAINGRMVPLEYRPTTALAHTLEGSQVYEMELKGLLSGDFMLFKQSTRFKDNVFLMMPYRPGRIPLVLVHGTASSPARWAEVLNEVINDRELLDRYQIWLFTYNTGNPVLYSAGLLAQGLRNIVRTMDPEGKEEALRKMVIVGHSQGGLLTKMTAVDSGTAFWDTMFNLPPDRLELDPEARDILMRSMFFEPLPFVHRVVFVATPHQGSFLVRDWVSSLLQRLISLPFTLLRPFELIFAQDPRALKVSGMKESIPRSTDNMRPDSPFIKTLSALPLAPTVQAHSIIAVANPEDPVDDWDDGVVTYESAHLEGVASELIVPSGHSAQDNPAAIEEIRRILIENLNDT